MNLPAVLLSSSRANKEALLRQANSGREEQWWDWSQFRPLLQWRAVAEEAGWVSPVSARNAQAQQIRKELDTAPTLRTWDFWWVYLLQHDMESIEQEIQESEAQRREAPTRTPGPPE
jgi:hypothetical protein